MTITINGEQRTVADVANLAALVESLDMKADRVAVELNLAIVPRAKWAETAIKDGDRLEIVHFVGGGSLGFSSNILRPRLPWQFGAFLFACVFGLALLLQAKPEVQEFLEVDACLDSGGSYDYKNKVCDFKQSHPYAPSENKIFHWKRLLTSIAAGITALLVMHFAWWLIFPRSLEVPRS